jgi:hypothetical protein
MRNPTFKKLPGEQTWESRPFQGCQYRIISRWLKGYTLYFNGAYLASDTRVSALKQIAREHCHAGILAAVNPYPAQSVEWTLLCKNTEYPKLGYIIYRCRELGIRTRFDGHFMMHADHALYIDKAREADGWAILSERHGRRDLDDVRDDHPKFDAFANEQPDEEV